MKKIYDTLIIGGGQAGLSVAYFLKRADLEYLIIDDREKPGGSWQETWDSLRLFSPVQFSSMPGWRMPQGGEEYPSKDEFIQYVEAYEKRYDFPIQHGTHIHKVTKEASVFKVESDKGIFYAKTLVSATGTAQNPYFPEYQDRGLFQGIQIHSREYRTPEAFEGQRVLIVGGGNSGAQILAEVSKVADTKWVTLEEPFFLPEEVDGRFLFNQATNRFLGKTPSKGDQKPSRPPSLNDIVVIPSVKEGLERQVYDSYRPFVRFYEKGVVWESGEKEEVDAVIWATGFKANLKHLDPLKLQQEGRIKTRNTRSVKEPNLWLVGYGNWTGFASATIYGVQKTARITGKEIIKTLADWDNPEPNS